MSVLKPYLLIGTLVVIAGAIYFINATSVKRSELSEPVAVTPRATSSLGNEARKETLSRTYLSAEEKSKRYELAKEITTPDGFINTDGKPITVSSFIGKKVILVDFWTYSCINCQRTTPYLNAWYAKYKDKGLVIIGVHTPEFEFEKNYNNVMAAVKKEGIQFPVVLDNDYSTWTAYKNRYWPHKYLIDIDGYIVYDLIGEGAYEETEKKIQEALGERMAVLHESETIDQSVTKEILVGGGPRSPETYFGSNRNEYLGNGVKGRAGEQSFGEPITVLQNTLYLIGTWNITPEYAETPPSVGSPQIGSDRINYRYRAKGVYLVAGSSGAAIEVEVLRDSKPLDPSIKGADVFYKSGKSYIRVQENRLYRIIDDPSSGDHFLELIISSPGLQAYTFTFG